MKIAFDFNGVMDTYQQILLPFIVLLKQSGHQVGLCTGNASGVFPKEYKNFWDFTIFCEGPEEEMRLSKRVATTHEEKMKYWKSKALQEQKVDLIFEDHAKQIEGVTAVQIGMPQKTTYDTASKTDN